uniref:Uncharacterized protein n=1 Tax=Arundo donax TaxID=35708 RepID=A0A0A8Z1C0_ARUDO
MNMRQFPTVHGFVIWELHSPCTIFNANFT